MFASFTYSYCNGTKQTETHKVQLHCFQGNMGHVANYKTAELTGQLIAGCTQCLMEAWNPQTRTKAYLTAKKHLSYCCHLEKNPSFIPT